MCWLLQYRCSSNFNIDMLVIQILMCWLLQYVCSGNFIPYNVYEKNYYSINQIIVFSSLFAFYFSPPNLPWLMFLLYLRDRLCRNEQAVTPGLEFSQELTSLQSLLSAIVSEPLNHPLDWGRWQKENWGSTIPLVPRTTHVSKMAGP